MSSAAPASSSASATQPKAAPIAAPTPSRLSPSWPNRLLRHPRPSLPRPRPSRLTWAKPPGCAPTTPPALLPRASSRPSPRPERPSARPLPRLSPPRRLRHGNPSRFPTTMPWLAVLLPMLVGTICLRSTCRVRRPRPSPLQLPPKRRTLLQLPGSPTPVRAAPSAIRVQPRASRRPRTRPKPHPQRLRPVHHLQAGGVAAQAGILLKKRTPCPGASVFRTCATWCRVYRIRADRRVTVGLGC